jgi:nitrogen fixation/metabolism regulation signal transduction histidine kinase
LRDAVIQMADGQLKQSVEIWRNDELGQLAGSFNSLAEQLQQAFAALEDRITELHQTQESLRESEAIFSSFMEYSPVYIFFKDKETRSLRLSKNYEQMLGMPISQMLGKTMEELFPSDLAKSMVEDDLRILNQGQRVDIVEELNGRVY